VNNVSIFRGIFWNNDSMNDDSKSESESSEINKLSARVCENL